MHKKITIARFLTSPSLLLSNSYMQVYSYLHGAIPEGVGIVADIPLDSDIFAYNHIAYNVTSFGFDILLSGSADSYKNEIIQGTIQILSSGIGPKRKFKYEVKEVALKEISNETEFLFEDSVCETLLFSEHKSHLSDFGNFDDVRVKVKIEFLTPTVILSDGKGTNSPSYETLYNRSLNRLITLGLVADESKLYLKDNLYFPNDDSFTVFAKRKRRSARGDFSHNLVGFMGVLSYEIPDNLFFKTYGYINESLKWGIGKTPSLGLGRGKIQWNFV